MRIGSLHGVVVGMYFWSVCPAQHTYPPGPPGRRLGGTGEQCYRAKAGGCPARGSRECAIVLVTLLENYGEDAACSTAWFLSSGVQLATVLGVR